MKKLIKVLGYTALIFGLGVLGSYEMFKAMAEEQASRETRRIEVQLSKCRGGGFCKVDGYRFLTISERRLP